MSVRARLNALRLRAISLLPRRWRGAFFYPPGHFYSPLVDFSRWEDSTGRMAGDDQAAWENIALDATGQRKIYEDLIATPAPVPLPDTIVPNSRYYARNDMFVFSDAFVLSSLLQKLRPRRVVEVGSGFSSAVMLDTADALGLDTRFTFIEIHPARLRTLLRPADAGRVTIDERPVQDVPPDFFANLDAGDILFIDSSHVAKIGSDVSYLLLRVLPRLRRGVYVHLHDIFFPESYPASWVREGRAWNESLFLRAFLTHNQHFQIRAFNAFAVRTFPELFRAQLPQFLVNPGGSLWMEKIS